MKRKTIDIITLGCSKNLVDNTQPVSTNAKADPTILFYIIELFVKQVQIKGSFSSSL